MDYGSGDTPVSPAQRKRGKVNLFVGRQRQTFRVAGVPGGRIDGLDQDCRNKVRQACLSESEG